VLASIAIISVLVFCSGHSSYAAGSVTSTGDYVGGLIGYIQKQSLSGSGKSTLVRCFNMLNKPTSGRVFYKDKDIGKFSKQELNNYRRNQVSMIFQQFGLMSHRDVLGNVEYGLEVKGMPKEERRVKLRKC